jgi:hypothetical protein
MNDFEKQVLEDLAELKTQMKALLGNGHPGRIAVLERRVERHETFVQRAGAIGSAFAFLITLMHYWMDYHRMH